MIAIDNLKIALFDEWTYDPPGGTARYYYFASGESYDSLIWPVDEIYDHLSNGLYDEELEAFKKAVDGLNKKDLTADDIRKWDWNNGGVGGECLLFGEGKEIIDVIADFYVEEIRDYKEEPYMDIDFDEVFEMDDDETVDVEFDVIISLGKGDGGDVSIIVPVTIEELKLMTRCAIENVELSGCDELEDLIERVMEAALWENDSIASELDIDEDFSNADCFISNPVATGDSNILTTDYIVYCAKNNNEDMWAVEKLLDLVEEFVDWNNNNTF